MVKAGTTKNASAIAEAIEKYTRSKPGTRFTALML